MNVLLILWILMSCTEFCSHHNYYYYVPWPGQLFWPVMCEPYYLKMTVLASLFWELVNIFFSELKENF